MPGYNIKRKKTKEKSLLTVLITSFLMSLILFVCLLALFSIVIMNVHTSQGLMQLYVITAAGVVALFTSLYCSSVVKNKRLIYGMIISILSGISEFLLIICFNNAAILWQTYILFPVIIVASFAGCIVGSNIKRK